MKVSEGGAGHGQWQRIFEICPDFCVIAHTIGFKPSSDPEREWVLFFERNGKGPVYPTRSDFGNEPLGMGEKWFQYHGNSQEHLVVKERFLRNAVDMLVERYGGT